MNALLFFTDITTQISSLCMLNIKLFNNKSKSDKDIIFIDPSVYELKKNIEYSNIVKMKELLDKNMLKQNEYISIDYPCDMNEQYSELFIEKSFNNNIRYKNNLHYICTIQFKMLDFDDFKVQFNRLKDVINISGKVIGIGNLCRLLRISENPKTKSYKNYVFCEKLFKFIEENILKDKWIHFYGISVQIIERYIQRLLDLGYKISIDSTKFTKARRVWFKLKNGVCCRKQNRNKYFIHYMQELDIKSIIF